MYRNITDTRSVRNLLPEQDAWMLLRIGKHRFWSNQGKKDLELLVIKTRGEE